MTDGAPPCEAATITFPGACASALVTSASVFLKRQMGKITSRSRTTPLERLRLIKSVSYVSEE
jgi:hypothetical protein